MKRCVKIVIVLFMLVLILNTASCLSYGSSKEANYEKDYLAKVFTSENGLEGTVANCVYSSTDGFLWIGGYTGLYRYDGTEFKRILIHDRALPINTVTQDIQGNLWIGTNGDGIYRYDGKDFVEYHLGADENGTYIINRLYSDSNGVLWIGTKAGLFTIDVRQERAQAKENKTLKGAVIQDISELDTGEIIIVEKTGNVFSSKESKTKKLMFTGSKVNGIPRCCNAGTRGTVYIGTTGNQILKVSASGKVKDTIDGAGLTSFNDIKEVENGEYWVCSDSGIGILKNDTVRKLNLPLDDSVEEVCRDYQGSFWFASSRQGVLQLYENYFSDLGSYWGLEEIVNSIQLYQDKIYVGCDSGLYCYQDKMQIEDELIKACKGERIRQIYLDQENRLWVSTYQGGIKIMEADGIIYSLNTSNSGLTTNQIRCVWQKQNKEFLVGTEEGIFVIKKNRSVEPFIDDEILSSKRILDVKEDKDGTIYAATDGYGIYVVKDGKVKTIYSKKQGLLSGVILKVVPSEKMQGVWIVTGEEITFLNQYGKLHRVEGIPAANSLDLQLTEEGEAIILAGNGFFRLKEEELLKKKEPSYLCFNKQDGLPIDFTANAYNIIKDDILYMCGTAGVASIELQKDVITRSLRLYINSVTEDGKEVSLEDGTVRISSSAHRLEIDVRLINFVHQNIYGKYFLEGVDQEEATVQECEVKEVGYTNLKGGKYIYQYKVYDADSNKCLTQLALPFYKEYTLWEEPAVRILLALMALAFLTLCIILIIRLRERQVKKQCQIEYLQEKEREISKLAYRDLVTGVYNRNCFEVEKEKADVPSIYALFSVSVNHMEYLKNRYGIRFQEDVLRNAADILQECSEEKLKIYRVSDNIFFFWMMEPLLMENYINKIKIQLEEVGKRVKAPLSFSVGAVYNNCVEKKTMDELINRCGKLRLLDEKHEEAKFFEGKMKKIEK